jgi:hypothetical protein
MTLLQCAHVLFSVPGVDGRCNEFVHIDALPATPLCDNHRYSVVEREVVYFLECGSLVKIGTSTDVETRVKRVFNGRTIVPDEVAGATPRLLGTLVGDRGTERALHAAFANHRRSGEWFYPEGALALLLAHLPTSGQADAPVTL